MKNKRKGKLTGKEIQFCGPGIPLQEPFVSVEDKAVVCSQLLFKAALHFMGWLMYTKEIHV